MRHISVMKYPSVALSTLVLLFLCASSLYGANIYVSPSGDGTMPSFSFATGYSSLYAAVEAAKSGDNIILDRATIALTSGNLTITTPIVITGVGSPEETIIDGEDKGAVIVANASGTVLQNFTITRTGSAWAGVMAVDMKNTTFVTNIIATKIGNNFSGNGRYLFKLTSLSKLVSSIITNNICPGNPGVQLNNGTMENCLVSNNANKGAPNSKGIIEGTGVIRNCTIINNRCDNGAVNNSGGGTIDNSIIYNNTGYSFPDIRNYVVSSLANTGNWANNCISPIDGIVGIGNFDKNPQFIPQSFYFFASSPCNGTANPETASSFDLYGVDRGERPSVGCVEYKMPEDFYCTLISSKKYAVNPDVIQIEAALDGTFTEPLSYSWDVDGDGTADESTLSVSLSGVGTYNVSLTITDAAGKTSVGTLPAVTIFGSNLALYVTNSVNPNAQSPYATPETAGSLVDAVTLCPDGGKIVLLPGTYEEVADPVSENVITIAKSLVVTSLDKDKTIITTKNGKQFAQLDNKDAVLENLTFTGCDYKNYKPGSVIMIRGGTLRNCVFKDFNMTGHGMIQIDALVPSQVSHCIIKNINASMQGPAGIKINSGSALITDCLFQNLASSVPGSGFPGAAIHNTSGKTIIRNSTFLNNSSLDVSPIYLGQSATIENCILSGNTTNSPIGSLQANDPVMNGTIISDLRSCCIYPTDLDYTGWENILTCNPGFSTPPFLSSRSPLVGRGLNSAASSEKDLFGNRRITGRHIDIGCVEMPLSLGTKLLVR